MPGGLMKLVTVGRQDVYLTGLGSEHEIKPEITFFGLKNKHKRHTHFGIQTLKHDENVKGVPDFGKKIAVTLSRESDMVHDLFLEIDLPTLPNGYSYKNYLGYRLIKRIEIEIGGQRIDRLFGSFIHILNFLKGSNIKESKSLFISDNDEILRKWSQQGSSNGSVKLMIPIPMFFELPLPLIALTYHEVKIVVVFAELKELIINDFDFELDLMNDDVNDINDMNNVNETEYDMVTEDSVVNINKITTDLRSSSGGRAQGQELRNDKLSSDLHINNFALKTDGVYLDKPERKSVIESPHEYLIHQLQYSGFEIKPEGVTDFKIRLNYNHPIKYFAFTFEKMKPGVKEEKSYGTILENDYDNFEYGLEELDESFIEMTLLMNGHAVEEAQDPLYFREYHPRKYLGLENGLPKGMYFYSFALKPMQYQPSGHINASKIDNMSLSFKFPKHISNGELYPEMKISVYAVNVQPLCIMSGMAGLVFSK
jgi:3-deoxy-D-manno-octulosonate 8-phosphate phosphatase KdsC-like HAD superfamily phosphatase